MSVGNLTEQFLYDLLPDAVIDQDERGYIEAVVSGFQDRLEDLRAYTKHLDDFWVPGSLPTQQNNVVLVDLTSTQGKSFTRSLDIQVSTPPDGSVLLPQWAATQLGLSLDAVSNVRYGHDPLRAVDANTLSWLAATLGTLLYQTDFFSDVSDSQVKLVETWFPRLKIKGTAQSFEVLGRILGFDDVRVTPLWTRLSPRVPDDVGDAANNPDFAASPEYFPQQQIGPFYDPFAYRDGPFFSWTGTAASGTNSTAFYSQTITGHNPWVDVVILGSLAGTNIPAISYGTVTHPAAGSYALNGGAPYTKAYVDCPGSSIRFQAIADGDAFNGLEVSVSGTLASGTEVAVTITDRLSAIKYRSSYFDLGLTADMDKIEDIFGSRGATVNKDLKADPTLTLDGTAVSPYRPWVGGSVAVTQVYQDWITSDGTVVTAGSIVTARTAADPAAPARNRQLNMDSLVAAGVQVTQAFEEVRAATRLPRQSQSGFLIDNDAYYAPYTNGTNLFVTATGTTFYTGSSAATPLPGYVADLHVIFPTSFYAKWLAYAGVTYVILGKHNILDPFTAVGTYTAVVNGTGTFFDPVDSVFGLYEVTQSGTVVPTVSGVFSGTIPVQSEINPLNQDEYIYGIADQATSYALNGSWDFSTGTYALTTSDFPGAIIVAKWTLTTTEVIRPEPPAYVKATGIEGQEANWQFSVLPRPEDDDNGLLYEVADDYPWRRDIVVGGELVELDSYYAGTEIGINVLDEVTAFNDQTGVDINVYGITSKLTRYPRIVTQPRSIATGAYAPGYTAIGYQGTIKNLSTLTPGETELVRLPTGSSVGDTETDYDVLFEPGYGLYHVGLATGVLVADVPKFFGPHHRDHLQAWYSCNEHVEDDLVVVDRARGYRAELTGIQYNSRIWDEERGWNLHLGDSSFLADQSMNVTDQITVSCWIKVVTPGATEVNVVSKSPVYFSLNGKLLTAYALDRNGVAQVVGAAALTTDQWTFVYITRNATVATFGVGTLSTASVATTLTGDFWVQHPEDEEPILFAQAPGCGFNLNDLRVWNAWKSFDDMELVRYHNPTPTLCTYRLGFAFTLDRQDKFGVRVLPSGWAVLDVLPSWYRRTRQGLVLRYDSMGSYIGEARFKETGIGDHRPLPDTVHLGQQFITLTGEGTAPFSTDHGQLPGWNPLWQATNFAGNYDVLPQSGSTATGIVPVSTLSGTVSPWPNTQTQTNPFRQYVWVTGSASGTLYQVSLEDVAGVPSLVAVDIGTRAMEVPTGAYVLLSDAGNKILVAAGGNGTTAAYSGTNTTPSLYLYTPSRVVVQVPNAYTTWTDQGVTPAQQHMDVSAMPSLAQTDVFGHTTLVVPCLGQDGVLEFSNTGNLNAGVYELTIVSGQIGQADRDFNGFAVQININDTILQRRLLRGLSGYNFSGTDSFQFTLQDGAVGAWLMSIDWTNALQDTARGTKRQLAIFSYSLRQLFTEVFKVDVTPSLTITQLGTTDPAVTPGGWFDTINSYGTHVGYQHESAVYNSNDTVVAVYPLGDTLTGSTNERTADVIYTGMDVVISDSGSFVFPSFGSVIAVPAYNPPLWFWAGGVTGSAVSVAAKMSYESPAVRLAVSESLDFGTRVYSDFAVASFTNNFVAQMTVEGLQPWTTYYYAVESAGSLNTDLVGTVSTFGTGPRSFSFAMGGDEMNLTGAPTSNVTWATIASFNPLFFYHPGDFHYRDISTDNINLFRLAYDQIIGEATHKAFWSKFPVDYCWDDHDFGGNDSSGNAASKPAARLAYRENTGHYPLPAGNGNFAIYHSFTVGRCRFIVTDNRSERTVVTQADSNNKTVLGAAQKAWFKQQLLAANADPNIAVIFWCNSFNFTGTAHPEASPPVEDWAAYPTERAEIANFIKDNGIQGLFRLEADMHALAIDDGRTYDFTVDGTNPVFNGNGIPVFVAAPLYQSTSSKGTPYQIGPMVVSGIRSQFGLVTVMDYGSNLLINFCGRDGTSGTIVNQAGVYMDYTLNGTASPRP